MNRISANFSENDLTARAAAIASRLQAEGFACCFVGGAVRDFLAGAVPKDIDLVTTATPEELRRVFPEAKLVGACFGVSLLDGFEIAAAREERNYLDGRRPEEVRYTRDLGRDVLRRDFTVNALLYDPAAREIIDYTGGVADLRRGVIRTVGDPMERFGEDYLRMLRAVRFAARMNVRLDGATGDAIRALARKTAEIAAERVRVELTAMLTGRFPERALRLLRDTGILAVVLPEVAALDGVEQPPQFHPEGDVFTHTALMLEHMAAPSAELAWSVLLHDVGKPATQTVGGDGRIRFHGHEGAGAEIAGLLLKRLRFPLDSAAAITSAIRRHMHFAQVAQMKPATRRQLLGSPDFALELELNRLDCISCHGKLDAWLMLVDEVAARAGEIALPEPLIRGRDLVEAGFAPGAHWGAVLREVFERQLAGEFATREEALDFAAKRLQLS